MQTNQPDGSKSEPSATQRFSTLAISRESLRRIEAEVTCEYHLVVFLNNQELATLICTPTNLEALVAGFLFSEGIINCKEDLKSLSFDHAQGIAWAETVLDKAPDGAIVNRQIITAVGKNSAAPHQAQGLDCEPNAASQSRLSVPDIFALTEAFQSLSSTYQATHGVHSAALCSGNQIIIWADDLGRHNAIDKVLGQCLLGNLPTTGQVVFTSGRIASDMVHKALKIGVPIILSVAVPTSMAIKLADQYGITLVGSIKNGGMTVFTHTEMIEV